MIINSFFEKNNTIIFNSEKNTARNPVAEIIYGGEYNKKSRFIFKLDLIRLQELVDNGYYSDVTKLKHTLKITNTGFFDWDLAGNDFVGKNRSSSFDLGLFEINQVWDSGVGYDEQLNGLTHGVAVVSDIPSNWLKATTTDAWLQDGAHTGSTYLNIQHFELGNENIEMDITNYVNDILLGNKQNYGLGLRYLDIYEDMVTLKPQYVGFFTNKCDTAYEPHLQTSCTELLTDDRLNFITDKSNRIYFYSYIGGELTNLDNIPNVSINNEMGTSIFTFTPPDVKQYSKGIYYVEFIVPSGGINGCTIFYDVWSNLNYMGNSLSDSELDITLKLPANQLGTVNSSNNNISLGIIGISNNEKLNRGDLRDVNIIPKIKYTNNQLDQNLKVYYRLYMKEGNSEITFFDYNETNTLYGGEKNFKLDTMSLLVGKYFLDVKWVKNGNIKIEKELLTFSVISETEYRISQ